MVFLGCPGEENWRLKSTADQWETTAQKRETASC